MLTVRSSAHAPTETDWRPALGGVPTPKPPDPHRRESRRHATGTSVSGHGPHPPYVREPPAEPQWNYIVALSTRWYRSSLYFCATHCCPGPNGLSSSFEERFARMEFAGDKRFHLAFMRYTGAWVVLYHHLPLAACLTAIRADPWSQMA
jgi:hypothetical protein